MSVERCDVTIIGAGTTGLMLTKKLSELGMDVALVEKSRKFAVGPSTRNEGWLHRGTYHATSIKDRQMAIQIAKRCIYGHEQIRSFAPESVEDAELKSYAVVFSKDKVEEAVSRWDEADVLYKSILAHEFAKAVPEASLPDGAEAFEVADVGIDTRILYQKLLHSSKMAGAHIFSGATTRFRDTHTAEIENEDGEKTVIESPLFIHTTGHSMKNFFQDNFQVDIQMRFWKSHLLVMKRLSASSTFVIDPGEAGMMNHGPNSIIGANEDAYLVTYPDYEPIDQGVENVRSAIRRLYPLASNAPDLPVACIKVDMPQQTDAARSLNISLSEPLPDHLAVLPGKMTESPYVTDAVTRIVFDRLNSSAISQRPADEWKIA